MLFNLLHFFFFLLNWYILCPCKPALHYYLPWVWTDKVGINVLSTSTKEFPWEPKGTQPRSNFCESKPRTKSFQQQTHFDTEYYINVDSYVWCKCRWENPKLSTVLKSSLSFSFSFLAKLNINKATVHTLLPFRCLGFAAFTTLAGVECSDEKRAREGKKRKSQPLIF